MVGSDENNAAVTKPTNLPGGLEMGSKKFMPEVRHNRRALGIINQKLAGAPPYPCVIKRRSSSQKVEVFDDNPPDPVLHRPITRRLAAQIASNQHVYPEGTKKLTTVVPNPSGLEDCTITDVHEHKEPAADQPVPMYLERTEALLKEKDQMEEVEMEDIFEESVMDIDGCDNRNPLAAVEYVQDIYSYYRKMETTSCASPNYMLQQFDINEKMRGILVDWLIEVHDKFELMNETLYLTVNIIDRFLAKQAVIRKKLQLVGLVAMLLACKYEEVSVPIVDDLILISDKAYTRKEVLEMERLMLNKLQFNMSVPTPYVFMKRFLKAAESDNKLEMLSFFMIELCLVEYEMLKFPPSYLAAAAIYTAQCTLYGFKQWTKTSEWHTGYSQDQLIECSRLIVGFHQKARMGKLTAVYRKYRTIKFDFTTNLEPANFLLDNKP